MYAPSSLSRAPRTSIENPSQTSSLPVRVTQVFIQLFVLKLLVNFLLSSGFLGLTLKLSHLSMIPSNQFEKTLSFFSRFRFRC